MTEVLDQPVASRVSGRAWRRVFLRCLGVPLVVTAPLLYLVPDADHRYNVYWHGSLVQDRPWRLITENLRTVPMYIGFGNFRPLGRMAEWSADTLAYVIAEVTHLPVQVGLRLVSALAAAVLAAAAVVFAEAVTGRGRMFAGPPARTIALLPFAFGGCLVAAGRLSNTVLFGGLYFLSAALVLLVAAWVCRGPRLGVLVVAAGAVLAVFNEVAAIGPPLATAAVLARGGPSRLRPALLVWLGFLPVFVPVRVLLFLACREGGCYGNSDVVFGSGVGGALANRLTAWLPPLQWGEALREAGPVGGVGVGAAAVALAVLAARLFAELPRLPGIDRSQAVRLAVAGGSALLFGALLGSINAQTQALAAHGRWGLGWRDSGITAAGGCLLLAGLLALAATARTSGDAARVRRMPLAAGLSAVGLSAPGLPDAGLSAAGLPEVSRAAVARAALVAFVLAGAGTATVNQAYAVGSNRLPYAVLTGAIAAEVAQFDATPAGNSRRCELLRQFGDSLRAMPYSRFAEGELPGTHSPAERMSVTASMATEQMYGRPFCS
ncbi:hypothetical protein [Paractinoplanes globisporus]|uniref:DUF2029 domain-containing protein n=1 Tax=Paractinoplanes globisporus TaxID=113565 RepID=A0ABW6WKJ3_9ACTN|nr:hypothetical protein [Actinoplanes globisporus]